MRPVGRADLAQHGAAAQHDVGDAELAADLDELAAGDDDLLAMGERLQREQDGRRVVVHDQRVLGAGEPPQQPLHVAVAGAALLGGEIELEVRVGGRHRRHPLERLRAQQRAAEVGVQHDAGGIDDRPQREQPRLAHGGGDPGGERLGIGRRPALAEDPPALGVERLAYQRGQAGPRNGGDLRTAGEHAQELIDGGQAAKRRPISAHEAPPRPWRGRARSLPAPRRATPGRSSGPRRRRRRDGPPPR